MNNDGSIIHASKVWRRLAGTVKIAKVMSREEAEQEAREKIKNSDDYTLSHWLWGYREMDGWKEQKELRIFYQFYFVSKPGVKDRSPQMVEVLAQVD
jgi:hypothetical protein